MSDLLISDEDGKNIKLYVVCASFNKINVIDVDKKSQIHWF